LAAQTRPPAGDDHGATTDPDAATELAFQGNLIPLRAEGGRPSGEDAGLPSKQTGQSAIAAAPLSALPAGEPEPDPVEAPETVRQRESDGPSFDERQPVPAARIRKPESLPAPEGEAVSSGSGSLSVHPNPDRAPSQADHPPAAEPTPKPDRTGSRIEPESPPAAAPPREIKFEVSSGGQRVELRVADRGGDVHVAVRTSDAHLAGALRDDLSALSSRLEQTGLRAEAWHTSAAVGGGSRRNGEPETANGSRDSAGQPGQDARDQPGDGRRRQPPETEDRVYEEQHPKEKGKEFAWFMSPLR
jgi:hypothetical protein